jgi:hypothetical protein
MLQQDLSRVRRGARGRLKAALPAAVPALLALALASCGSTFDFHVRTPTPTPEAPSAVESVFVFFAKEAELAGKTDPAAIASLVHPSTLKQVYGYAEFGLESDEKGPRWVTRSSELRGLELDFVDARSPLELRFHAGRGNFETYKDLALGVVVRTTSREYRLKTWPHSFLANAERGLLIEVDEGEIQSSSL